MAYRSRSGTGRRISSGSANINLNINTTDGDYLCESNKVYTEKSSIIQDLDNSDAFITISSFSKSLGALTVQNAKAIVLKNISDICQEVMITMWDWRNDSGSTTMDLHNSVDMNEENSAGEETAQRNVSIILPAGEFIYLPNNRMLGYSPLASSTLESAAKSAAGTIAIEPKDINSGNEYVDMHVFSGSTYNSGADIQVTEDVAIAETAIDVDDGDFFEVGDLIMINSEVMSIESISTNTLTVKRGLLGSTEAAHSDDDDLRFFFGNEHLAFDNGKCQTDANGRFKQRGAFFGYGRTSGATGNLADGIVAGSVAIGPFYTEGGYLDWGLTGIKASDKTGLAASTTYTFHIVVDEYNVGGIDSVSSETAIAFTTDASDTTFAGSGNAVLPKVQSVLDEKFYDASSGLFNKKVTIGLHNGDIRVTSHSNNSDTRVGIANVSGTTPFGVGRFPALSSSVPVLLGSPHGGGTTDTIVYGPASTLASETITDAVTGKEIQNLSAFILDDGNGNLLHNGGIVGSISYVTGHCEFTHVPYGEFKIYAESLSAHSGGSKYVTQAYNTITAIDARSMNPKADSKIEMLLLG
tara:strand:+ start:1024 stop:2769 length:1746 start_codon:yes stop_codon:yes gene_type:complete